jgi:hypothetical protein
LAPAVEEATPTLEASKTVGFKAILYCKSSVNLGWINILLVEKPNDHSPLMESDKMLNVHVHRCKMNDY